MKSQLLRGFFLLMATGLLAWGILVPAASLAIVPGLLIVLCLLHERLQKVLQFAILLSATSYGVFRIITLDDPVFADWFCAIFPGAFFILSLLGFVSAMFGTTTPGAEQQSNQSNRDG